MATQLIARMEQLSVAVDPAHAGVRNLTDGVIRAVAASGGVILGESFLRVFGQLRGG